MPIPSLQGSFCAFFRFLSHTQMMKNVTQFPQMKEAQALEGMPNNNEKTQ